MLSGLRSFFVWIALLTALVPSVAVFADVENCSNVLQFVPRPGFISGKEILPLPKPGEDRTVYEAFLRDRYGFKLRDIVWGKKYPMLIHGGDEASFLGKADFANAVPDPVEYDAVIIGAGPSGITAGTYLTDAGKRVLILEKEATLGGLAAGGQAGGAQFGRGAAYFTATSGEVYDMYNHMGFGRYKKNFTIHGAIDSYYWNGKFYKDLWEDPKTLAELPASFELFKHYMHHADHIGLIPTQPFDEFPNLYLDTMTMKEWVNTIPAEMKKLAATDPEAKRIYERFLADATVDKSKPMEGPLGILELYGRSALGGHPDVVSAAFFANFYISELDMRYTGSFGTGSTMEAALKKLQNRDNLVTIETRAPLAKIKTVGTGADAYVEFYYVKDGVTHFGKAKDAVFSAQLNVAAKTIEDFEKLAPEQFNEIKKIRYSDYLVINTHVEGHPWTQTYDTWVRNDAEYSQNEFTDIIDGRWQEFQGTKIRRKDNRGVLTIYKPLPENWIREGMTAERVLAASEEALAKMKNMIETADRLVAESDNVNILAAEVNRWPYSVHIAEPGHAIRRAKILKRPIGNILFANNNLGSPAIEEAVFNGYNAAKTIIEKRGVAKGVKKIRKTTRPTKKKAPPVEAKKSA